MSSGYGRKAQSFKNPRQKLKRHKVSVNFGRKIVISDPLLNVQNKYLIEQTPEC